MSAPIEARGPTESPDWAIKCSKLSRTYTRRIRESGLTGAFKSFFSSRSETKAAISELSICVAAGTCTGLVGANGAGKTTLLKMCAGLLHPTSGEIEVLGYRPTDRRPEFQRRIGMVMGQKSQLWVDIPATETFELLAAIYQIPTDIYKKRVSNLAEIFQVEKVMNTQVRRLSLGERMKLEIIASLLHNPELLIFDEPTIGLDVIARRKIREFIKQYNAEYKTTVIISSHDMTDIEEICSQLILVSEGKVLFDGPLKSFESKFHDHSKLHLRNVEFRFDVGHDLSAAAIQATLESTKATLIQTQVGVCSFQIEKSKLPILINQVVGLATPADIRIEGQSLETLVHELMTNEAQSGRGPK